MLLHNGLKLAKVITPTFFRTFYLKKSKLGAYGNMKNFKTHKITPNAAF
jgi:hypothetical protein